LGGQPTGRVETAGMGWGGRSKKKKRGKTKERENLQLHELVVSGNGKGVKDGWGTYGQEHTICTWF